MRRFLLLIVAAALCLWTAFAQLGNPGFVAALGSGSNAPPVGGDPIGETFEAYSAEDPLTQTLNATGPWGGSGVAKFYQPIVGEETFESYSTEDPLTQTLSGGNTRWSGAAVYR